MQKVMLRCQNLRGVNFMDKGKPFVIFGAGGHSKVVVSCILERDENILGILDDDSQKWGSEILGIPIIGPFDFVRKSKDIYRAVIALGDNKLRKSVFERYKEYCDWEIVIHPKAYVHKSVKIGQGTVIFAGATVQPNVKIGDHVIINTGTTVDHDCIIESFVHLAPGVHMAGSVCIREGSILGIGSSVIPNKNIGAWSIIGAGAVVINDIPSNCTAVGVPAKPIKFNNI